MSVLPEEFPVVLTVFLAMGAWRISRVGVLTRRMPAVESIGAATVLAVDKTGTLTENRMRLALVETADGCFDLRRADVALRLRRPRLFWQRPWQRASATRSIRWSAPSTRRRNDRSPSHVQRTRPEVHRARVRPHAGAARRHPRMAGPALAPSWKSRSKAHPKQSSICAASPASQRIAADATSRCACARGTARARRRARQFQRPAVMPPVAARIRADPARTRLPGRSAAQRCAGSSRRVHRRRASAS